MENDIHAVTNEEICKFAEIICKKNGIVPEEAYPRTFDSTVMESAAKRQLYVNRAIHLLMRSLVLGATLPEMARISEYLLVLMRSIDKKLNYELCEKELRIAELENKYSENDYRDVIGNEQLYTVYIRDIIRLYGEGDVK